MDSLQAEVGGGSCAGDLKCWWLDKKKLTSLMQLNTKQDLMLMMCCMPLNMKAVISLAKKRGGFKAT